MASPQQTAKDYFESSATYWRDVYCGGRLLPTIYRARRCMALRWIRRLRLPAGARILEVGCGAGAMTISLSRNRYTVDAMDSALAMLKMTRRQAVQRGVQDRVRLYLGDVHALPFDVHTFDLAIAIGVIPWLHSELIALREMQRVLKPGGYLVVTADNNARLNRILDPASCPVLKPLRSMIKRLLQLWGKWSPPSGFQAKRHYPWELDRMIAACNFQRVKCCTVGFGPFTFLGKTLFGESTAVGLHRTLEKIVSPVLFLRRTGCHYVVLAKKRQEGVQAPSPC